MPNLKAKLITGGVHEITSIATGEVIGKMELKGSRWWINGAPYSHSFLASLAEFEEEQFIEPSPISDLYLLGIGALMLLFVLSIGALISWGFM